MYDLIYLLNIIIKFYIMQNIEKQYQVKIGATATYKSIGHNRDTENFIASMEGKKIWNHWFDDSEDDFSEIWISQYEKTWRFKIPVILLEEYIEETENEEIKTAFNFIEFLEIYKKYIIIFTAITIIFILFNLNIFRLNASEIKQEKTIFETLDDRDIMLSQKENLELKEQKQLRQKLLDSIKIV